MADPDHILDATGLYCPEPVMLLHNKIRDIQVGETVEVSVAYGDAVAQWTFVTKSGKLSCEHDSRNIAPLCLFEVVIQNFPCFFCLTRWLFM